MCSYVGTLTTNITKDVKLKCYGRKCTHIFDERRWSSTCTSNDSMPATRYYILNEYAEDDWLQSFEILSTIFMLLLIS